MLILFMFIALTAMICLNVPIAVALAISAVIGLIGSEGPQSLVAVGLDMYNGSTNFALIAIPMFVLAGAIMNAGGITDRLINFVSALIGFVRGGLAMINIGVSLFFAEISGSAVADVARSEEHTSELQSLMRISYAVFCLKKKNTNNTHKTKM